MPPLTKALFHYVEEGNILFARQAIWQVSPIRRARVGCLFYDLFGGNTLKADVSISVTELGSLLDHTGPYLEAEVYIARTFGAE